MNSASPPFPEEPNNTLIIRIGHLLSTKRIVWSATLVSAVAVLATAVAMHNAEFELDKILYFLYADMFVLLVMLMLVITRLAALYQERRFKIAGASLHTQMVLLFSLIAATPAVLVVIFASVFLNVGLQGWFSERVRVAIDESVQVATAYMQEHRRSIRAEALAMANDINREAARLVQNPALFDQFITNQSRLRNISEAIIIDGALNIRARTPLSQLLSFDMAPAWAFEQAEKGEIIIFTSDQDDRVRAMMKLLSFADAMLLVGRFIDPLAVERVERVEESASRYQDIEQHRNTIQKTFAGIFILMALLVLLTAAWVGFSLADGFINPIVALIRATERARRGDMGGVPGHQKRISEIDTLVEGFNAMTKEISAQRTTLLEVNDELDLRRQFTETVLAGVSAGVVGLDQEGLIDLPNGVADDLLGHDLKKYIGKPLVEIIPEIGDLLDKAGRHPGRIHQREILHECADRAHEMRTLLVRLTTNLHHDNTLSGYVVTFDDITDLQMAQRQAAWADVARRIAHEIKNPLTPIQLSAERLKRKYASHIHEDSETFVQCTDIIVRQVKDIQTMIDEFSDFARMPDAVMENADLVPVCRDTIALEQNRFSTIEIVLITPVESLMMVCDTHQISRAIGNAVKNASEALLQQSDTPHKKIHVTLSPHGMQERGVDIIITDNGPGWPKNRARLLEPYVTDYEGGSGLGLAIIHKIMEDHQGELIMEDEEGGGARLIMRFAHESS